MKVSRPNTKEEHVRISARLSESSEFRNFLALSRDSYPMGLGRLAATALQVLVAGRRQFSRFELDRIVQWPADRKLSFAEVLETVGWAKQKPSGQLVELLLPDELTPRKPYKERARFRAVRFRNDKGQWASRDEAEREVIKWKNQEVLLIDMDGYARVDIDSISKPEKPSNIRRRSHGIQPC